MANNRFAPGSGMTFACALAFVLLLTLGTWQAAKVGPKSALIEQMKAGMESVALDLPVHLDDPGTLEYRRVRFIGTVMNKAPVRVFATNERGEPGFHLYLPVEKPHGLSVLVNFGWQSQYDAALAPLPLGQTVEVSGTLRQSAVPGLMTPANEPDKQVWFTANVHELAAAFGLETKEYYHFRVFADQRTIPGPVPEAAMVRIDIPNNHFQYALTWYGLALALTAVYVAFGLQRGREKR